MPCATPLWLRAEHFLLLTRQDDRDSVSRLTYCCEYESTLGYALLQHAPFAKHLVSSHIPHFLSGIGVDKASPSG
jgi:hypothetical protein